MINITLYKFNKRPNSTKVPATGGDVVPCVMKSISSVITPIIEITDPKANNNIPLYNYAYIPAFNRYYFIEDVRYDIGVWTLFLRTDVLASYKDDIENSRQYVLRSYTNYNPHLVDTLYNTYIDSNTNYERIDHTGGVQIFNKTTDAWVTSADYFDRSMSQGGFCIGVVGNNTTGVSYYIMPATSFRSLLNRAFSVVPADMTDVSSGVAKALFNPLQYVSYCRWFPSLPLSGNLGTMVRSIYFGGQEVEVTGTTDTFCYQVDANMIEEYRVLMTLPKHPQSTDYPYLSLSPFSEYSLYFQPFGVIPLDSTKIYNATQIDVHWFVDYCTGACELQIFAVGTDDPLVYTESTQIGVNLPVSNLVMDWKTGLGMAALSWIKSVAPNDYASRNMTGGVRKWQPNTVEQSIQSAPEGNISLTDTIMNTLGASMGQIATKGSSDSFLAYNMGQPFVFAYFMDQTAHFDERYGRPCCKNLRLDSLTGFVMCGNASVEYTTGYPTVDEQNAVVNMLNSGVFIE